jgi:hypothetical protein
MRHAVDRTLAFARSYPLIDPDFQRNSLIIPARPFAIALSAHPR